MTAIYNELDPFAAQWLRNLITAGEIAPGRVDDRSIKDLAPADVAGPGQRHFFAGIAGWSLALRLAGVPDDADIWTGSCPCQSFSSAGKQRGFDDPRHLWPDWFRLIRERRPPVILGEQSASALAWPWLDLVFADLEGEGYSCAAADLPACSVGAPHRRQRLFFVAYADEVRQQRAGLARFGFAGPTHRCDCGHVADSHEWHSEGPQDCQECSRTYFVFGHKQPDPLAMAYADSEHGRLLAAQRQPGRSDAQAERSGEARGLADTQEERRGTGRIVRAHGWSTVEPVGHGDDVWSPCDWIPCSDGVSRPVEPGTLPLVTRLPGRVGLIRGYGNAFSPQVGAAFIRAALEARP